MHFLTYLFFKEYINTYFPFLKIKMSDEYRQYTAGKKNCKQGHWTGIPKGGSGTGCWLCQYGCAILSYLYWKGLEPNETNVTKYLNDSADVVWSKMGLTQNTKFQAPCIGRLSSKTHFVYIKDSDYSVFDPGSRNNTKMQSSDFKCYYY